MYNISNAILIFTALYFYYCHGLPLWATVLLIVFAILTWNLVGFEKERKRIFWNISTLLERLSDLLQEIEVTLREIRRKYLKD